MISEAVMESFRRILLAILAAAAAAAAIAAVLPSKPAGAAGKQSSGPAQPEPIYEHLQVLMARGMMPNYQGARFACERDDREALCSALDNISELAGRIDKYVPPRNAAYLRHYAQHMAELQLQSAALAAEVARADRSALLAGVLRIHQSCQSCHEDYAPEDRREARKWGP
jgi:hypothetical protein